MPDDDARGAAFAYQKQVFDAVAALNDPGAADALAAYAASKPHVYFETRAALALGALGDRRAVPYLAHRLRLDPLETYGDVEWEAPLKRDDGERVAAARLLGDLAILHPEALPELRAEAEEALIRWLHDRMSPHANGLRALALMNSQRDIDEWRFWANPQVPLPHEGQQPPLPEEFVIAQSALRWVGKLRDPGSRDVLYESLEKRPKDFDSTMASMMQGGGAILGMSLRALAVGGADGLSEWGEPHAFGALLKFIDDRRNNEEAQQTVAATIGWVASDAELKQLAKRLLARPKDTTTLTLASAVEQRPVAGLALMLVAGLSRRYPAELRVHFARAIGRNKLDAASEAKLAGLLKDSELRPQAALALMLGGSPRSAIDAVRSFTTDADAREALSQIWHESHAFLSDGELSDGALLRYIENSDAIASLNGAQGPELWASKLLGHQLQSTVFDNGPHSVTRVVMNGRLLAIARGGDEPRARLAVRGFYLLKEAGTLLALSRGNGAVATAAKSAHALLLADDKAYHSARPLD